MKGDTMKRVNIDFKGSKHSSYLLDGYENYRDIFETAIESINKSLVGYPNFDGVDFCDVNAGGIQIRGYHKQIEGHTYGYQPTIKEDLSNIIKATEIFIDMWKTEDTPAQVQNFKDFLEMGKLYGWD